MERIILYNAHPNTFWRVTLMEKTSEQSPVITRGYVSRVRQLLSKPAVVIGIIILVAAAFVIFAITTVFRPAQEQNTTTQAFDTHQNNLGQTNNTSNEWPILWGQPDRNCKNNPSVRFTALPIALTDISLIEPIGELREGHIVPGDHAGIEYQTSPSSKPVKVVAPADGIIVHVERHAYTPPAGYPQNIRHYHFYMVHSCTLFTGYVHLTEFTPEILAANPALKNLDAADVREYQNLAVNIPVKAGQQIGTAWTFGLLGVVTVDLNVSNKGYLNPQTYRSENWRPHAVSFFDYLDDYLKSQIMGKNPRSIEPRGGKIDFDIDGKLVGNWFEQGSGGFRDESKKPTLCGNFPCPYWNGHLAFVYDFVDPTQLRVSVGHDWGLADHTPFGVKGNNQDFKNIGVPEGMIKYELVALKDISKEKGFNSNSTLVTINDESKILGILLVQMMENQKIKVEIFPGKTKEEVTDFTSRAKVYTR